MILNENRFKMGMNYKKIITVMNSVDYGGFEIIIGI